MTSTAIVPTGENVIEYLQALAKETILERNGNISKGGPGLEAEVNHEVLCKSVELRQLLRDFQGQLAAHIYREHLWVHYPHMQFADDYTGYRLFLASTGLGSSTVSELAALYYIVPMCDSNKVEIDKYLGAGEWTKTREAVVEMKRAARDNNLPQMKRILASIDKTAGADTTTARAALRERWRTQREDKPGSGTTFRLSGDRQAVVVVFDQEEDLQNALTRLGPITNWNLLDVELKVR